MNNPARTIAACFALTAFAVAVVSGLAVGNPGRVVLRQGIGAILACQVIGWVIASVARGVVERHVHEYRAARPVGEEAQPVAAESPATQKG